MIYSTQLFRQLRRDIGANIHHRRTERKLPLRKLSKLTGVPEALLDQYELGKGEISLQHLLRIGCVLDNEVHSLIHESQLIRLNLSPEVVDFFKSKDPGWQTRIDRALRAFVEAAK